MHAQMSLTAAEALAKLKAGNEKYLTAEKNTGKISPKLRALTAMHGQQPYAIILTCADSRVIPEAIFMAGLGELFVIRVAGNVIDAHQLGSIEYAAGHRRNVSFGRWPGGIFALKQRLHKIPSCQKKTFLLK